MEWLLFISQLPASPSSLRVNVWRKLRAAGAMGLQNGVWLLPNAAEQARFLDELLQWVKNQGAGGQVFTVAPLNESVQQDILARFQADRDEEYAELHERCVEFLAEIDKETGKQKFTFAELEENEQDLLRLQGWLEKIQKRDFTGGEAARQAGEDLEHCRLALEAFSAEVYRRQAPEAS